MRSRNMHEANMKTAEQLAKEYVESLKLGSYGNEYDAFIAGYIACLSTWKWSEDNANGREEGKSGQGNTEAVSGLNVPWSR